MRNVVSPSVSVRAETESQAGTGSRRKRKPCCNRADTGQCPARKGADFRVVFRHGKTRERRGNGSSQIGGSSECCRREPGPRKRLMPPTGAYREGLRLRTGLRRPGSSRSLRKGLSRMWGNSHVRFSGGWGLATAFWLPD